MSMALSLASSFSTFSLFAFKTACISALLTVVEEVVAGPVEVEASAVLFAATLLAVAVVDVGVLATVLLEAGVLGLDSFRKF